MVQTWEPCHRPMLRSTLAGGQWPQQRVARVLNDGTSNLCKLCGVQVGTLLHRHDCQATMPCAGWPRPTRAVDAFITALEESRRHLLVTRGIAAVNVNIQAPSEHGWFRWGMRPTDDGSRNLRWYIDGSAVDGPSRYTTRLGFGIVVTTDVGQLVGYGYGSPPAWVHDAAGAEAWASPEKIRSYL